jgi:hypothetical protein
MILGVFLLVLIAASLVWWYWATTVYLRDYDSLQR